MTPVPLPGAVRGPVTLAEAIVKVLATNGNELISLNADRLEARGSGQLLAIYQQSVHQ